MSINLPSQMPLSLQQKLASCKTEEEVVGRLAQVHDVEEFLQCAVKKDRSWCLEHKDLAERLIEKYVRKSDAVERIKSKMQLLFNEEEKRYAEIQKYIQNNQLSKVWGKLEKGVGFTEAHKFEIAKIFALHNQVRYFLFVKDPLKLSSCSDRTDVAILFGTAHCITKDDRLNTQFFFEDIAKFCIDDLDQAMRFAREVAEKGGAYNLSKLAGCLYTLKLNQGQSLEVAHILAKREMTMLDNRKMYPLQLVINEIDRFQLEEKDRIALALELMERVPGCWSSVSHQIDKIAPESAEVREMIARRFLEHPNEEIFASLVRNIGKFALSPELLREIYSSALRRKEQMKQEGNGDERYASGSALTELLKQCRHFPLSPSELHELALLAADSDNGQVLLALAGSITEFPLSDAERIWIAGKITEKAVSDSDKNVIRLLCQLLEKFHLPEKGFEKEKFALAMTLAKNYKWAYSGFNFMDAFKYFRLENEENRALVAVTLLKYADSDLGPSVVFTRFSKFHLSKEKVLQMLPDFEKFRVIPVFLENISEVVKNKDNLERLQFLFSLLGKLREEQISDSIASIFYLGVGDQALVSEIMSEMPPLYRAIDAARLGEQVMDLFPKLFSDELLGRFSNLTQIVRQLIQNTKQKNRQLVAHQLVSLLLYLMLRSVRGELCNDALVSLTPLFTSLFKYRTPHNRVKIFFQVESLLTGEGGRAELSLWGQIMGGITEPLALIPAFLLLHQLKPSDHSTGIDKILRLFQSDIAFLKDGKKRNSMMHLIQQLDSFSVEEACTLFEILYREKKADLRNVLMQRVSDLLQFNRVKFIKKMKDLNDIDQQFESLILEALNVKEVKQFSRKYSDTFGRFRQRNVLLSYAAVYQSKLGAESGQMAQLRRYFLSVLEGEFPAMRYDHKQSEHLKMLFADRKNLEEKWKIGECIKPADLIRSENAQKEVDANGFLQDVIIDKKQLGEDQENQFPTLIRGLSLPPEQKEESIQTLKAELESLKSQLKMAKSKQEKDPLGKKFQYLQLELRLLEISRHNLDMASLFAELSSLPKLPLKDTKFKESIHSLSSDTRGNTHLDGWSVVDTDDPNDLLLMGVEIQNSCQWPGGSITENKCLVAYLVDGKNRLVAVKDEKGRLIGRAVLRILWDGDQPVLFREDLYVNHEDPLVKDLIEKMCLRRAKALGLDLYCGGNEYSTVRLTSFGSPAPYEYVDASTDFSCSEVPNGKFVLNKAKPIWRTTADADGLRP